MVAGFPSAAALRTRSRLSIDLFDELSAIERAIFVANEDEQLEVVVGNTIMTDPEGEDAETYFAIWKNQEEDRTKELYMNEVIRHFTNLGYNIERLTNADTGNTFKWVVSW